MTDIVDRANAALEGITPGTWVVVGYGNVHAGPVGAYPPVAKAWGRANMAFIAAAPELARELVAKVELLQAQAIALPVGEELNEAFEEYGLQVGSAIQGLPVRQRNDDGSFRFRSIRETRRLATTLLAAADAAERAE